MLLLVTISAGLALSQISGSQDLTRVSQSTADSPRKLFDGSVFVPKPSQRQFNVRTFLVQSGTDGSGVVLPREAVLRGGDGRTWVWLHGKPEHFHRRQVRIAPNDAERALVLEGLYSGERVVVSGADLIDRVRE